MVSCSANCIGELDGVFGFQQSFLQHCLRSDMPTKAVIPWNCLEFLLSLELVGCSVAGSICVGTAVSGSCSVFMR